MSGDFGCLCTSGRMEISLGEVQRSIYGGVLGISGGLLAYSDISLPRNAVSSNVLAA